MKLKEWIEGALIAVVLIIAMAYIMVTTIQPTKAWCLQHPSNEECSSKKG